MNRIDVPLLSDGNPIAKSIEISLNLDTVGLVGGDYESNPTLFTWCSFNPHRITRKSELRELSEPTVLKSTNAVYTQEDHQHKFNRSPYRSLFFYGEDEGGYGEDEDGDGGDDEDKNAEFRVPQNMAVYELKKPIQYDLSSVNSQSRTDATIWLKLMAVSLSSGVPKIDEGDRVFKKVERSVQTGVCQLQLYDLFNEAAAVMTNGNGDVTFDVDSALVDPKLLNIAALEAAQLYVAKHNIQIEQIPPKVEQKIMERALARSRKALLVLRVTLRQFDVAAYRESMFSHSDLRTSQLNAYLQMRSTAIRRSFGNNLTTAERRELMRGRAPFDPILYNSMPGLKELVRDMEQVIAVYCQKLVPLTEKGSQYKAMNKNVERLHLPRFVGEQGITPVVTYFASHTPHTREYANEELRHAELQLYDYDDGSEELLELMFRASLRRHGLSRDRFIAIVAEYFSESNRSNVASGLFITALKVIADVGTFAANSVYYTADFRYQKLDDNVLELTRLARKREAYYKKINLDSFDSNPLNGTGSSDDCEGSANVACTIIQSIGHGRYGLGFKWRSALLNSAKRIVDRLVIFALGATVTSAYFSSDNKPMDMTKDCQLPLIGDKVDVNSRCDGHCYGMMMMDALADRLLANGDLHPKQLAQLRERWREDGIVFTNRDFTVPVIMLEGTGSVEPTVLPVDEVFDHQERRVEGIQAKAEISFLKEMKAKLAKDEKKNKPIMEMFSGEGVEFYTEKQPANRRISRFYREVIHGVSCSLYAKDVIFSQLVFCKRKNDRFEYGVNTGELLRSGSMMSKDVALIAPFKECSQMWQEKIRPMMESIQNQMPIMKLLHYSPQEMKEGIYSRFLRNPNRLNDTTGELIVSVLESVADNPTLTIVRLQTREWKLTDKKRVDALNKFIMSFDRVVCHGMFSEKHIASCDALVDILIVVRC